MWGYGEWGSSRWDEDEERMNDYGLCGVSLGVGVLVYDRSGVGMEDF